MTFLARDRRIALVRDRRTNAFMVGLARDISSIRSRAVKKIGIIFGMENTFPPAVVDRINGMKLDDVEAEFVKAGVVKMAEPSGSRVIIERISQDIPFYRAYLHNSTLIVMLVIIKMSQ